MKNYVKLFLLMLCGSIGNISYADELCKLPKTLIKYESVRCLEGGLAPVKLNNQWGYINAQGELVIAFKPYEEALYFYEGLAPFKRGRKWGFINKQGQEIIPAQYDKQGYFKNGLAIVAINGKYGAINKTNQVIIPSRYDEIYDYGKIFEARLNNKWGIIDRKEKVIAKFDYDRILPFNDSGDFASVKIGEHYGVIHRSGKLILPIQYNMAYFDEKTSRIWAEKDGKKFWFDKKGSFIMNDEQRILSCP